MVMCDFSALENLAMCCTDGGKRGGHDFHYIFSMHFSAAAVPLNLLQSLLDYYSARHTLTSAAIFVT